MTAEDSPTKGDIDLFPVLITEFLVISIVNAITIAAFARNNHLRKRSTYLIMNLTVADLLVGVATGPLIVYYHQKNEQDNDCTWPRLIICAMKVAFPIISQINLSLISLERLHATLFPFRHCLITKCFYFRIIIACWLAAIPLAFVVSILSQEASQYAWASFSLITLLSLAVCYIIIIVNVQSNPHSKHRGSIHNERKLSVTLFIVTGVSVLTILPFAIFNSIPVDVRKKWDIASSVDVHEMLGLIYLANSIVNPLLYAIRMQEFRRAFLNLVSRQSHADQRQRRALVRKQVIVLNPKLCCEL